MGWRSAATQLLRGLLHGLDEVVTPRRLRQILGSILWLLAERGVQLAVQLFVGLWVIRYLQPEGFGLLSYCLAFALLVRMAARLGLESVVTRDLARDGAAAGRIMAATLILRIAASIAFGALIVAFALIVEAADTGTRLALLITAAVPFAQCGDIVQWWFNAQTRVKLAVLVRNIALLTSSLVRVGLILLAASWPLFVAAMVVELLVGSAVGLALGIRAKAPRLAFRSVTTRDLRRLTSHALPLLFASLAILVYMYADVIMLKTMVGPGAAGIYAGAVRISEIAYILPVAIVGAVNPTIVQLQTSDPAAHARLVRAVIRGAVLPMLLIVAVGVALAGTIVDVLLGPAYAASAEILRIHIWTLPFVAIGSVTTTLLVNEHAEGVVLMATVLAALLNIALNLVLIPHLAGIGCAIATMLAQIGSSIAFLPLLGRQGRAVSRCFVSAARPLPAMAAARV